MKRKSRPRAEPQRGRRRDAALTARILTATLDLLAGRGVQGLRMEDVAARARTSKQAVYRRWRDKSQLIANAVRAALEEANPTSPDTGDLREDLATVLANTFYAAEKTSLGGAIRSLVAETGDWELVRCLRAVERSRRQILRTVLARARARGQLAPHRDLELDIDAMLGAGYFRLLIRRVPLGRGFSNKVVDAWLARAPH